MSKTDRKLKEYSNASDIDVSKIPQSVINELADLLYDVFIRHQQEKKNSEISQNNSIKTAAK